MKVRDVIKILEKYGWTWVRTRGSHRQFTHPEKQGVVTVPGHLSDDMMSSTLNSIAKQSGISKGLLR